MRNNREPNKRRDKLEIIAEILEAAKNGSVKTRIMYKTNLNFFQFEQYVNNLLQARLVKIMNDARRKIYKTTEKGCLLLKYLRETSWIFEAMENEGKLNTPIIMKESNAYIIKK